MKLTTITTGYPSTLVVVLVAFLSTMLLVNATSSVAASGKKKSAAVTGTTAVDYTESRIKQLQVTLNITEGQEQLWNNLTLVMRENAKEVDALTKDQAEKNKTMNALDHMKFHRQFSKAQLDQQDKFIPPFEALYAIMSDEQKKSTDTLFRTGSLGKQKKR